MQQEKKRIVILGCTGSIGVQTLDVVRQHSDKLKVVGLSANTRVAELLVSAREFDVHRVAVGDAMGGGSGSLRSAVGETGDAMGGGGGGDFANDSDFSHARNVSPTSALNELREFSTEQFDTGAKAIKNLIEREDVDIVVNALVGAAGVRASYDTLQAGKTLALANKESLVVAGDIIMPMARKLDTDDIIMPMARELNKCDTKNEKQQQPNDSRTNVRASEKCNATTPTSPLTRHLMPIDSEHGAIYQCLLGEDFREVAKLWVTASGGPFRGRTLDELEHITPAQALAHPTWNMGAKISIDSSTLMNKGLEVIEAHHLFNMPYDKIEVVVQPQSAIHSMVEFTDGSVKAHLGTTDMRIPIQFALSAPKRWSAPVQSLDFRTLGSLDFEAPDTATFRCLALARHAGETGGTLPCVMNAVNEVAVDTFLKGECAYTHIAKCVEGVMTKYETYGKGVQPAESIEQLLEIDAWARKEAYRWFKICVVNKTW